MEKSSSYNMTVVEYYRDYYAKRMTERVSLLICIQRFRESEGEMGGAGNKRERVEEVAGVLDGQMALRRIGEVKVWERVAVFL